ncbi:MAG: teichuronic acid exporter [Pseudoalteromonas distincta]|jgi:teichuronic acid exporter
MTLKKKAIRGFIWNLSNKIINQLGYIATTIYISRLIGPESFGLIGMITVFILLAESIVSGGFTQALVQRSHSITEEDASTIFYVNMTWGIFMYIALFFSAPAIADFYSEPLLVDISRVMFLVILINSFSIVAIAKLTINIDFKSQAIAGTFAVLLSSFFALYLSNQGYGIWSLVGLILSKALFQNIGLWYFCRWYPKLLFSIRSFNMLFKFGSNLMLAGLGSTLLNNLYIALIGRYFNAASVGYFTQGANLSNFLSGFISSTLQGVTYPVMTSIKEDRTRLVEVYKKVISVTMLVSLPLLIGFASIADVFVLLFLGEDWSAVIPVLFALCLARAVTPINSINMNILNAIGRSDLYLKVDLSKYPMVLGGFFIGINYGIIGVAWVMVGTSLISFFINAYYPGKFFGFGAVAQLKVAYKYILAAALMFISVISLSFEANLWLILILKVALGIVVYFIALIIMRDSFLLQFLQAVFRRAIAKLKLSD